MEEEADIRKTWASGRGNWRHMGATSMGNGGEDGFSNLILLQNSGNLT